MGDIVLKKFKMENGESLIVRTALPEDADQVLLFTQTIMNEAPYLVTASHELKISSEQQLHFLKQLYEHNGKIALLAEYENEMIGFLDFHNGNRERIQHQGSFGMSVKKEFRHQGVGKALLNTLLEWADNNPLIEKLCLEVFDTNVAAIALYRNLGFTEEGVKKRAIKTSNGSYHDLILMALFLD
ncbi:GNAT family N-acetyltransferase [Cytobacillus spongiae]|jgi:RimJ/RimL family protein N-acetyltransferase|uniref:GNAT family N-acetyltransferase n=1 Tax=Cytobacillus spongiae TaxID=2901381 RepID=UPI001F279378|nr:GNAT family protein [Cytobacillus spongiae]UII56412.1 GNAT family N-acetyltransferase [Cytobacillus spongiae]